MRVKGAVKEGRGKGTEKKRGKGVKVGRSVGKGDSSICRGGRKGRGHMARRKKKKGNGKGTEERGRGRAEERGKADYCIFTPSGEVIPLDR